MKIERHRLLTRDGIALHTQWAAPSLEAAGSSAALAGGNREGSVASGLPSAATLVMTHGLGEYSSRYRHVVEPLVNLGWEVGTYDLRGHGRSTGRRGDAPGFHAFLDDLEAVLAAALERQGQQKDRPPGPLFLYGHSLGGLITLRFLQERLASRLDRGVPIAGAVIASPWLRLAFEPARWKLFLAKLARHLCPGFRQITGMDPSRLSRDQEFLLAMPDRELSHHQLSARLFYEIQQACETARIGASGIRLPLLFLHGQADPVTSWAATRDFYETAGSRDKTLKLYPEAFHETHNDLGRTQVITDIVAWLKGQLATARAS